MQPLDLFKAAIERADHLLRLYDLLHDSRSRGIRSDWATSFKSLMHWPSSETIVRVDGQNHDSILILRESVGIDRNQFSHDYVSELLRAAVVAAISALDRYLHDLVLLHSWKLLNKRDDQIPEELKKISVSVIATKKALQHLRKNAKARPGHIVKRAIQERLHRDYTFQKPDDVLKAAKMLGISDFWQSVATEMPDKPAKSEVINYLRNIANRRNQIVHEADLVLKTKAKEISLRDISRAEADDWIKWIADFVNAIDRVVTSTV